MFCGCRRFPTAGYGCGYGAGYPIAGYARPRFNFALIVVLFILLIIIGCSRFEREDCC